MAQYATVYGANPTQTLRSAGPVKLHRVIVTTGIGSAGVGGPAVLSIYDGPTTSDPLVTGIPVFGPSGSTTEHGTGVWEIEVDLAGGLTVDLSPAGTTYPIITVIYE